MPVEGRNTSYFGDIIAGLGDVSPAALAAIQNQGWLDHYKQMDAAAEAFKKSQLGLLAERVKAEEARTAAMLAQAQRPVAIAQGGAAIYPGEREPFYVNPKDPRPDPRIPPNQDPELHAKALAIANDPTLSYEEKFKQIGALMQNPNRFLIKPPTPDDPLKNKTEEQQVYRSLAETLGRPPTWTEVLEEMDRRKIAFRREMQALGRALPFNQWPEEDKVFWYEQVASGAPVPRAPWGDREFYSNFNRGYAAWQTKRGIGGAEAGSEIVARRALQGRFTQQQRMMGSIAFFSNTIDRNIGIVDRLEKQYGKSTMGRMINQAQNLIRRGLTGSGDLEALRLALVSTSNEIAKLESGSLGIAEVLVNQAQIMGMIHDINLNMDDMRKVLNVSRELGHQRRQAGEEELARTKQEIAGLGKLPAPVVSPKPGRTPPSRPSPLGVAGQRPGAATEEAIPTDRLPDPSTVKEGRTAGGGKYIMRGGRWQLNR